MEKNSPLATSTHWHPHPDFKDNAAQDLHSDAPMCQISRIPKPVCLFESTSPPCSLWRSIWRKRYVRQQASHICSPHTNPKHTWVLGDVTWLAMHQVVKILPFLKPSGWHSPFWPDHPSAQWSSRPEAVRLSSCSTTVGKLKWRRKWRLSSPFQQGQRGVLWLKGDQFKY